MEKIAYTYRSYGLSVLPIKKGEKKPQIQRWNREFWAKDEDVPRLFFNTDIAIITGEISGNLEVVDFDNHNGQAYEIFKQFINTESVKDIIKKYNLPYERTPSGGYHLFYRCNLISGSKKLAFMIGKDGKRDTSIETKGSGGYVVVSPSTNYTLKHGSFSEIATITEEERSLILTRCKSFNEICEEEVKVYGRNVDQKPGDMFDDNNPREEIVSLLLHNGWKCDRTNTYFTRPGKETGISATLGVCKKGFTPLFYVFSSNAFPFESEKSYTPFAVFSILGHGGDFKSAARELAERYGLSNAKKEVQVAMPNVVVAEANPIPKKESNSKTPVIVDCENYLYRTYEFRYDIVRNIVESRPKGNMGWDVCNENTLFCELLREGFKVGKDTITSLLASDFVPRYDPFLDYFEHIQPWDGVDEFHELLKYLKVDEPDFFRDMLEKQFVRAIKCAIEPNFYNRFAFVFQSRKQEQGKSRLIRFLNPFGDKYITEEIIKDNKDCLIALSENFIYSLEELDDMKDVGVGKLKAILAKNSINVRHPYGKQKVSSPRRCTFFGSTNLDEFLTDDVNTRWLIFNVDEINDKLFTRVNIHALWAQAWALYNDPSYNWDLTDEEKKKREFMNMSHKQSTVEEEFIMELFEVDEYRALSLPTIIKHIRDNVGPGIRINLDTSYIYNLFITMGFKTNQTIIMNRVQKSFYVRTKKIG